MSKVEMEVKDMDITVKVYCIDREQGICTLDLELHGEMKLDDFLEKLSEILKIEEQAYKKLESPIWKLTLEYLRSEKDTFEIFGLGEEDEE